MKRLIFLFLSFAVLLSLWGCEAAPVETTAPTEPSWFDAATVDFPQTGQYQETALMANVPDQGTPLLLDVRQDGSVDYFYTELTRRGELQVLSEGGVHHYVIGPDGAAVEQPAGWMAQLDAYNAEVARTAQLPDGRWRYLFAADEGVILILAQYHDVRTPVDTGGNFEPMGDFRHSAMFKVENGSLSKIPVSWNAQISGRIQTIDTLYVDSIAVEDGVITLELYSAPYVCHHNWVVRYTTDGAFLDAQSLPVFEGFLGVEVRVDADGMVLTTTREPEKAAPDYLIYSHITETHGIIREYPRKQWTEDDTLYRLGRNFDNLEMTAGGEDGTFYCWFREVQGGLLMRYRPNPAGVIEPEIVTVWSLEQIPLIETAVAHWNSTHTSPIFRYETAEGPAEDALTRLRLELSNGQGPDVLILDGWYTDGILDYLTPLNRLDLTGVYENMLEPFTEGGDVMALPLRMEPYLLGRDVEGTREIGSLEAFADVVTATDNFPIGNYRYWKAMYNIYNADQLYQLWYPAWSEAIWENGRYHSDVFRELLTELDRLRSHYELSPSVHMEGGSEERSILNATDGYMHGNDSRYVFPYTLAATDHLGLYNYWWYDDGIGVTAEPNECILGPIPGPDGSGASVARVITGVRVGGSESAGLEFLQLLLTDEMQMGAAYFDPADADGYPVTRSATEKLLARIEDYMGQPFAVQNDFHAVLSKLHGIAMDDTLYWAALEAASGYYTGKLTMTEAVDQLGESTRIYLMERS